MASVGGRLRRPKESAVLAAIVRYLKAIKAKGHGVWWLKVHGGPMQTAGVPDLVVIVDGRTYWLEVKRPGEEPTPLQAHTHEQMRTAGAEVTTVRSVEDVAAVVWDA